MESEKIEQANCMNETWLNRGDLIRNKEQHLCVRMTSHIRNDYRRNN